MTPREIRKAILDLEVKERSEVEAIAQPIREKYHLLREQVKEQCEHNWKRNFEYGVCPWDVWYYCSTCTKSKYEKDEQIYKAYCDEEGLIHL